MTAGTLSGILTGRSLPDLALPSTMGGTVTLRDLGTPRAVLYLYPMTGRPGVALPEGWDATPGARGCTSEACSFRDHLGELRALGADVYGLSSQSTGYQREAAARLGLRFPLLSDRRLSVARALGLPTFTVGGMTLFERMTMVVSEGIVEHVFHPVLVPHRHADEVLSWLRTGTAADRPPGVSPDTPPPSSRRGPGPGPGPSRRTAGPGAGVGGPSTGRG